MTSIFFRGVRNVGYLFVGNILSTIIRALAIVFIARQLGVEDFGYYQIAGAFIGIFAFIKMDGINKNVIRDNIKYPDKSRKNLEMAMGLKHFFALLAMLVILVATLIIPSYDLRLKLYIGILSFQVFLNSTRTLLNTVYQVKEDMKYISIFNIIQSLLFAFIAPVFVYLGYGVLTLIIISLVTNLAGLILNYKWAMKFIKFKFWNKLKWEKNFIKASVTFSLISIIISISTRVDLVMISIISTPADAGIYAAAMFFVTQGSMVRNIISTAFFPVIMKRMESGKVKLKTLLKFSVMFYLVVLAGAGLVSIFSNQIIYIFYGDEFQRAGLILGVLVFALANTFAGLPYWNTLIAIGKEKAVLFTIIVQAVANIPLNLILFHYFGLVGISISTLIVGTIHLFILFFMTYITMKKQKRLS